MIQLEHINKTYRGATYEITALKEINLKIEKGEFISIMGKSGSGKSTLLNILGLVDTADSGSYYLEGQKIEEQNKRKIVELRTQHISFVFQHFALINELTVFENIEIPLIPRKVPGKKRKEKIVGLADKLGISDLLKKKPGEISGGQKQRVAIARALISGCDIILADEPTGALDSKTGEDIMQIFDQLHREGKTIVVVTHDIAVANHANRMIILEDGDIVKDSLQI